MGHHTVLQARHHLQVLLDLHLAILVSVELSNDGAELLARYVFTLSLEPNSIKDLQFVVLGHRCELGDAGPLEPTDLIFERVESSLLQCCLTVCDVVNFYL